MDIDASADAEPDLAEEGLHRGRRLGQSRARLFHRQRPPPDARGDRDQVSRSRGFAGRAPRRVDGPGPVGVARRGRDRPTRGRIPRRRTGRRRGSDRAVRAQHAAEPAARGRHGTRAGSAAHQPVRTGTRRSGRFRGADRVARWSRWVADTTVHPASRRMDARRGGPARGAGDLPEYPTLARLYRDPPRQAGRDRGSAATTPTPSVGSDDGPRRGHHLEGLQGPHPCSRSDHGSRSARRDAWAGAGQEVEQRANDDGDARRIRHSPGDGSGSSDWGSCW